MGQRGLQPPGNPTLNRCEEHRPPVADVATQGRQSPRHSVVLLALGFSNRPMALRLA